MSDRMNCETTDVLICGCGPTGAMLSGYLGKLRVRNIILEKEADITTDPRGIALDDDGIRLIQGLGLYEHVFTEIGSYISKAKFIGGTHRNLHANPFLHFDTASTEGQTGHVGVLAHKQPILEKHLRSTVESSTLCELRSNCLLTSISEDDDWVYATYKDASGEEKNLRAKFLAAADGKTGFTRKMYLEQKGIRLEWAEQYAIPNKLILHFPLWDLGYTPEEVYDLFFPKDFRFLCNPDRPAVCGRFGLPKDCLWRFEFLVSTDEDGKEMASEEKVREVVYPYLIHPGSHYGLKEDVSYPEDCIEVLRSRPFRFSARSCNKWALNRVILCGDAAHVFPPFGGQGITSGFRDAVALAWRLAIACKPGPSIDYEPLLRGWYLERKQQLDSSLASTVKNGEMVNAKSRVQVFLRDWVFWVLQLVPTWKHWLERGPRGSGPTHYTHTSEMPFLPEFHGGVQFPQTYCISLTCDARVQFTDDVIFSGKRGIFQIVALLKGPDEVASAMQELADLKTDDHLVCPGEATFFVPRASCESPPAGGKTLESRPVFRTATSDEFARSSLCDSRPDPRGYNESLMWDCMRDKRYIALRFDRFVYAMCDSKAELEEVLEQLNRQF
ncbi:hypothetical protein N7450_008267 [Penicillium hetheringtonii]|uniref:FAD-binding domain-containing protein n=1 Tax=Penicillium hetheringtonii TaxID=911720 RepID=A0AAD6DFR4_9EURO|nr:hypothetical protein N7450_008267 [Penicillium hetheringtonii]